MLSVGAFCLEGRFYTSMKKEEVGRFSTNHSTIYLCRGTISESVSSFQSGGAFAGWRALTIESMQMSGCGEGHEPKEIVSKKLWLKFPVAPAEVEIWTKKGDHSLKKNTPSK